MGVHIAPLTRTELDWLVMALNHDISAMQEEIDHTTDTGIMCIGKMVIDGREKLRTKLLDIIMSGRKTIVIE